MVLFAGDVRLSTARLMVRILRMLVWQTAHGFWYRRTWLYNVACVVAVFKVASKRKAMM